MLCSFVLPCYVVLCRVVLCWVVQCMMCYVVLRCAKGSSDVLVQLTDKTMID